MAFKVALLILMVGVGTTLGTSWKCFDSGDRSAKSRCGGFVDGFCDGVFAMGVLKPGDAFYRCSLAERNVYCDFRVGNSGPTTSMVVSASECKTVLNDILNNCDMGGTGVFDNTDRGGNAQYLVDPNGGTTCGSSISH